MVLLALAHTKGKFEPDAKELSRGVRGSARAHWVYPLARRLCTARRTVDPEQVQGTFDNPSAPSVLASRTRARELAPTTGTNIPTIPAPEIMVGTNFGYSNGVYFQNVVTQIVLPQRL